MVDIKKAVGAAKLFLIENIESNSFSDLMLEEVDRQNNDWLITLGFTPNTMGGMLDAQNSRVYKIFEISGNTGEVISMKIRKP